MPLTVSVEVGRELRVRCGRAVEQVHHLEDRRGDDDDVRDVLADRVVGAKAPERQLRVARAPR